jgi:serine/threonine protein kinase
MVAMQNVILGDFGVGTNNPHDNDIAGTDNYKAPEMILGGALDVASDIW